VNTSDVRIEFISDPEHDHIVCEVYFKDRYLGGLFAVEEPSAPNKLAVHFESFEPIKEALALDDYLNALTVAKERYVKRLHDGPAPGELG
jgi:hypothetical protein